MTFVSYAQNFEDVMLSRALKDFGPGFYVDVGAADPVADSVTKAFYDAGWCGINIEPMAEPMALLRTDRPRDINLQIALEDACGTKRYFSIGNGRGLSTGVEEYADRHRRDDWTVDEVSVAVDTLTNVCRQFVRQEIQFLKVDVEGNERAVLAGADFEAYRPWILVVESTQPNTRIGNHSTWEPILTKADYVFALFDGLNRYYIAREKEELFGDALSTPANVLDDFVLAATLQMEAGSQAQITWMSERLDLAQTSLQDLKEELDSAYQQVCEGSRVIEALVRDAQNATNELSAKEHAYEELARSCDELDRAFHGVYASRSWKVTRPLRTAGRLFGSPGTKRGRPT